MLCRIGLEVLIQAETVFQCHQNRWKAIWYAELGSSRAILEAGYNLGSFMTRWEDELDLAVQQNISSSL